MTMNKLKIKPVVKLNRLISNIYATCHFTIENEYEINVIEYEITLVMKKKQQPPLCLSKNSYHRLVIPIKWWWCITHAPAFT